MSMQYKKILNVALGAFVSLCFAIPANAQRPNSGGNSGGGGGGSRPATGGSAASARPSGGGGVPTARPSFNNSRPSFNGGGFNRQPGSNGGMVRPQPNFQRGATGVRGPVFVDRQGNVIHNNPGFAPRTGAVMQNVPRGATAGGLSGYRPGVAVGHGGYWGNHGYYHYSHGYYNSYYAPRLGFSIGVLPYGYYPFFYGDYQYYYSDGLFYSYDNNQYTVVEPPVGAQVNALPEKAQSIVINGQQYYEADGVYYQLVTKDDGSTVYEVAGKDGELNTGSTQDDQQYQGPQMGDIVAQLPADCRKIKVNGTTLFVSPDGVYYQQQADGNGNTTYKIVGLPSDEPDQGQN